MIVVTRRVAVTRSITRAVTKVLSTRPYHLCNKWREFTVPDRSSTGDLIRATYPRSVNPSVLKCWHICSFKLWHSSMELKSAFAIHSASRNKQRMPWAPMFSKQTPSFGCTLRLVWQPVFLECYKWTGFVELDLNPRNDVHANSEPSYYPIDRKSVRNISSRTSDLPATLPQGMSNVSINALSAIACSVSVRFFWMHFLMLYKWGKHDVDELTYS